MKTDLFKLSSDDKKIIEKISSLCGVKQDVIKMVFEYLFISNYLNILDNKDAHFQKIQVPFIGTIIIRSLINPNPNNTECEESSADPWIIISDNIKDAIKNIKNDNHNNIIQWLQSNYIDKIIEQIEET